MTSMYEPFLSLVTQTLAVGRSDQISTRLTPHSRRTHSHFRRRSSESGYRTDAA